MAVFNTSQRYGIVSILLHWLMAVLIIALFVLGQYMVDLDYYDAWYKTAPDIHRSMGVVVALLLVFRIAWRYYNPRPESLGEVWEKQIAAGLHQFFYVLIIAIVVSGYLITTAEGQAVSVFNWVDIPATLTSIENQEDLAGDIHASLTTLLIVLVVLHALAALKHHFINRDNTLLRILGKSYSHTHATNSMKTRE